MTSFSPIAMYNLSDVGSGRLKSASCSRNCFTPSSTYCVQPFSSYFNFNFSLKSCMSREKSNYESETTILPLLRSAQQSLEVLNLKDSNPLSHKEKAHLLYLVFCHSTCKHSCIKKNRLNKENITKAYSTMICSYF